MRRPRQKLSVSTFPFLAVLLSAMGALIFLLLVMDRRAKIVARTRAQEALAARDAGITAKTAAEEARLQAEWEAERDRLHALLLEQDGELHEKMKAILGKMADVKMNVALKEGAAGDLRTKLEVEKGKLEKAVAALALLKAGLDKTSKSDGASKSELEKWTRDLVVLEMTLNNLKRLKGKESQTYSLVPYRGKLGEARRPIYVECDARGILFHPEQTLIVHPRFDALRIRSEVEERGLKLVKEKTDKKGKPTPHVESKNPYVLFLVRPGGIDHYYDAVAALSGFDIDFGYELIDANWTLDFSGDKTVTTQTVPSEPSKLANLGNPILHGNPSPNDNTKQGSPSDGGVGFKSGGPKNGSGVLAQSPGFSQGLRTAGPGMNGTTGEPGVLAMLGGGERPRINSVLADVLLPKGLPEGLGRGGRPTWRISPGPQGGAPGNPGAVGTPGIGLSGGGPGVVGSGNGGTPGGKAGNKGQGSEAGTSETGSGTAETGSGTAGQTGVPGQGTEKPNGDVAWRPTGGSTGPKDGTPGTSNPGGATDAGATDAGTKGLGGVQGQPGAGSGEGSGDGPVDPIARLAPPPLVPRQKPKADGAKTSTSPSRTIGNRDFVLTVECFDDVVALYPGGQSFEMKGGQGQAASDDLLVRAVVNLVNRRQASVRADEPPYRPQVRFQVHPNALRTYFHVYPLLERLRMPMTRENLES